MQSEHTIGFYLLENERAQRRYALTRAALSMAQKRKTSNVDVLEKDLMSDMYDRFLANDNLEDGNALIERKISVAEDMAYEYLNNSVLNRFFCAIKFRIR